MSCLRRRRNGFQPDATGAGGAMVRCERLAETAVHPFCGLPPPAQEPDCCARCSRVCGTSRIPHVLSLVAPAPHRSDSSELAGEAFAQLPRLPGRLCVFEDPTDQESCSLMSNAGAVCQPSTSEGFGLLVQEAIWQARRRSSPSGDHSRNFPIEAGWSSNRRRPPWIRRSSISSRSRPPAARPPAPRLPAPRQRRPPGQTAQLGAHAPGMGASGHPCCDGDRPIVRCRGEDSGTDRCKPRAVL